MLATSQSCNFSVALYSVPQSIDFTSLLTSLFAPFQVAINLIKLSKNFYYKRFISHFVVSRLYIMLFYMKSRCCRSLAFFHDTILLHYLFCVNTFLEKKLKKLKKVCKVFIYKGFLCCSFLLFVWYIYQV